MRIYVSSTLDDLNDCRNAVRAAIQKLNHQPVGVDTTVADAEWDISFLEDIENCDFFIGIYARRYGPTPEGETRSITELEFDQAISSSIPCLCYRLKEQASWPAELTDTGDEQLKLEALLKKVEPRLCGYFSSPEELAGRFSRDLGRELGRIGNAYADLGQHSTAIEYYDQALEVARLVDDRQAEGKDLGNLGLAFYALGEVAQAIEYYEQALGVARAIGDRKGEGIRLGNLGVAYRNLGELSQATECYEQALAIARETGDRRVQASHLGNLGNLAMNRGEVRKALEYYEQALAAARASGDRQAEASNLFNLSLSYEGLQDNKTALNYCESALKIYEAIQSPYTELARQHAQRLRDGENKPDDQSSG